MRSEHQTWQARTFALVASADVADRIEMGAHASLAHPAENEFGGSAMFAGQIEAREMVLHPGNRAEFRDPADDLFAEREPLKAGRICVDLAHFLPAWPLAKSIPVRRRRAAASMRLVSAPARLSSGK